MWGGEGREAITFYVNGGADLLWLRSEIKISNSGSFTPRLIREEKFEQSTSDANWSGRDETAVAADGASGSGAVDDDGRELASGVRPERLGSGAKDGVGSERAGAGSGSGAGIYVGRDTGDDVGVGDGAVR